MHLNKCRNCTGGRRTAYSQRALQRASVQTTISGVPLGLYTPVATPSPALCIAVWAAKLRLAEATESPSEASFARYGKYNLPPRLATPRPILHKVSPSRTQRLYIHLVGSLTSIPLLSKLVEMRLNHSDYKVRIIDEEKGGDAFLIGVLLLLCGL